MEYPSKELLNMYSMLNEEQKNKIFTKEQKEVLDKFIFFNKMFNDPSFYKAVCESIGEVVYEELRG